MAAVAFICSEIEFCLQAGWLVEWLTFCLPQNDPSVYQERLRSAQERPMCVPGASQERPGGSQERPGASQERPRSVPGASRSVPGASQDGHELVFGWFAAWKLEF